MLAAAAQAGLARFDGTKLGPHAGALLDELRRAVTANMPLGATILAATLVDVVANEDAGPAGYLDGVAFSFAGNKAALGWLRRRRNGILHHEQPINGLMGETDAARWLVADAERAVVTLLEFLADLDVGGVD